MTRGVAHPPELRAQVIAAIATGESLGQVAQRFGISKQTAAEWASNDQTVRTVRTANARTREELSALVYDALAATLRSLVARADATGRADWIEKQSAAELAQLGAADWDRVIRIIRGFREPDHELPEPADAAPRAAPDDP